MRWTVETMAVVATCLVPSLGAQIQSSSGPDTDVLQSPEQEPAIIGKDNSQPVNKAPKKWQEVKKAVARITIQDTRCGTGFLVDDYCLITCAHVLQGATLDKIRVWFDYEDKTDPYERHGDCQNDPNADCSQPDEWEADMGMIVSDGDHEDVGLLKLKAKNGKGPGETYGCLTVRLDDPKKDDEVHLIHHPQGRCKEYSHDENAKVIENNDDDCENSGDKNCWFSHGADAETGSSGSPVFGADCCVLGMTCRENTDSAGNPKNCAVKMSCVKKLIEEHAEDFMCEFKEWTEPDPGTFQSDYYPLWEGSVLDDVMITFWGCAIFQPYMVFLADSAGRPLVPAIQFVLFTGIGGPVDRAGSLNLMLPCSLPPGMYHFVAIYLDPCNGNRVKISNPVAWTVHPSPFCDPSYCFGQRDDGVLEGIYRVANPAGSSDYFNVDIGFGPSSGGVNSLIGVEIATWNFCSTVGVFDRIGVYAPNYAIDPSGSTPDVGQPISEISGAQVPAGQSDWSYPATFYDTPDAAIDSATQYHVGVRWSVGDSCLWIGADTDCADGPCGHFGKSFFSQDAYQTPSQPFTAGNWMHHLIWQ